MSNVTNALSPSRTMSARRERNRDPRDERLLVVDEQGALTELAFSALPSLLEPGDVVVVNDAGTRPSSLALRNTAGDVVDARIVGERDDGTFDAVLFGDGSWRDDTDLRPPPPTVALGASLRARSSTNAIARVVEISPLSSRLVALELNDAMRTALFVDARPVQYSYIADDLTLSEVQTPYASRPWASEMPSAGRALTVGILVELRRRGVEIARVTAAAGLSATGDPALERLLPFAERYELPRETVDAIARARRRGRRVIAIGTSTVRALESNIAEHGELVPGAGIASMILGPATQLRVVDAILSGMHETGSTHDALLRAFAPDDVVDAAVEHGRRRGLLIHELGDHCLLFRARPRVAARVPRLSAMAAALGIALLVSACGGACASSPPIVERALPDGQRDELRVAVANDLVPHCGKCHQSTRETAKLAALAVFDLDKRDGAWTSTMTEHQLRALPTRLPMLYDDSARARVSSLIGAELASRSTRVNEGH